MSDREPADATTAQPALTQELESTRDLGSRTTGRAGRSSRAGPSGRAGRSGRTARSGSGKPVEPAAQEPVARVLVDVPLAHLDRPFDYLVPAAMAQDAVPGARVKVRFAGKDVDGFVLERCAESDHGGRLAPLRRVVSAEPVLSPQIAELSARVAARYAGTRSDVLRLAVPPRHATTEREPSTPAPPCSVDVAQAAKAWSGYTGGAAFVRRLAEGEDPRCVWSAAPGEDWPRLLAEAAAATSAGGRGALLCVPDRRDIDRLDTALTELLGPGRHVVLTADLGPAARYRSFLALARGAVRVGIGTRAAAFAPVRDLGLVGVWDDGDDLHAEPRAPYPHTREVLLLRAHSESTAALVGGFARTAEAELLVRSGWAQAVAAPREVVRERAARTAIAGASDLDLLRDPLARTERVPKAAYEALRAGLQRGPVLVQTPRQGYAAALACDQCRAPARCGGCGGPLRIGAAHRPPACGWCGGVTAGWSCPGCGGRGLRAPIRGDRRTAEELGRAFPSTPVRTSSGDRVLAEVPATPALVVATPGAEPVAEGGYACVLLLDTWLMLSRTDLRITEEALRRWLNAAALARPAGDGGQVVVVGDSSQPVLQALLRWDPAGHAARELDERAAAHFPPASRLATVTGGEEALAATLAALTLPPGAETLGPVPVEPDLAGPVDAVPQVRVVIRVPRAHGADLSRALAQVQGVRAAKKLEPVRVEVDPVALG